MSAPACYACRRCSFGDYASLLAGCHDRHVPSRHVDHWLLEKDLAPHVAVLSLERMAKRLGPAGGRDPVESGPRLSWRPVQRMEPRLLQRPGAEGPHPDTSPVAGDGFRYRQSIRVSDWQVHSAGCDTDRRLRLCDIPGADARVALASLDDGRSDEA